MFYQGREAMGAGTPGKDLAPVVGRPFATRICRGVSRPQNWLQLVRFAAVGGTGYLVSLCAFAACVHVLSIDYRISAVIAFVVAVCNNFWLYRHWTFGARHGHLGVHAVRFFAVSLGTSAFTYLLLLVALVEGARLPKVPAQAIAIAFGTPRSPTPHQGEDIRARLEANYGRPASPGAPSSAPPASPRCADLTQNATSDAMGAGPSHLCTAGRERCR